MAPSCCSGGRECSSEASFRCGKKIAVSTLEEANQGVDERVATVPGRKY